MKAGNATRPNVIYLAVMEF